MIAAGDVNIWKKKKPFTVLWVMRGHRLVWNGSYKFCVLSWPPSLQIPQLTTKFAGAKLSHEAKLVLLSAACGYQTRILPRCQRNSCCKLLLAILSFGGDITSLSFTLDKDLQLNDCLFNIFTCMYICTYLCIIWKRNMCFYLSSQFCKILYIHSGLYYQKDTPSLFFSILYYFFLKFNFKIESHIVIKIMW